jgi:RNA-directed DNA polymerase
METMETDTYPLQTTHITGLGLSHSLAIRWANTRQGYWRVAHSPILSRTLDNKWLEQQGYVPLSKLYKRYKERSQ